LRDEQRSTSARALIRAFAKPALERRCHVGSHPEEDGRQPRQDCCGQRRRAGTTSVRPSVIASNGPVSPTNNRRSTCPTPLGHRNARGKSEQRQDDRFGERLRSKPTSAHA
jgi:hypothetical protein